MALPGLYVALGLAAIPAPRYEVFPFFCWFLFPVTPNLVERYSLDLTQVGGQDLPEPTPYQSLSVVGKRRNSMDFQVAVQALGKALDNGDLKAASELRKRIEANFLPAPCAYSLRRLSYDPIRRWQYGAVDHQEDVASFKCGDTQ